MSPAGARELAGGQQRQRPRPSYSVNAFGQTYAIGLVFSTTRQPASPAYAAPARPPASDIAEFGQPAYAASSGESSGCGRASGHWSRNSVPDLIYLLAEGTRASPRATR